MKLKGKILSGFLIIVFIVTMIFISSIYILSKNMTLSENIQKRVFPETMSFMDLRNSIRRIQLSLTNVSANRGHHGYASGLSQAQKDYQEAAEIVDKLLDASKQDTEVHDNLKKIKKNLNYFFSTGKRMVNDYINKGTDAGNVTMYDFEVSVENLITPLLFSMDEYKSQLKANIEQINSKTKFLQFFFISASALIIILSIIAAIIITNIIVRPLNNLIRRLNDISEGEGDLTARLKINTRDELFDISVSFNKFVEKIQSVIKTIDSLARELADSSEELSTTSMGFSQNTQTQAASVEEITATVEEISAGMETIANNSVDQFNTLTSLITKMKDLSDIINEMEHVTEESTSQTNRINDHAKTGKEALTKMKGIINKIETSSLEMKNIISMISDISDRINLLSLNAAIESARAGESGRGFAVVADEISKLADQTASSINEIDSLIKINSEEINEGINNVGESIGKMQIIIDGVIIIDDIMKKIKNLMKTQLEMNDIVKREAAVLKKISDEIKISTGDQKIATDEIVKSITLINELLQTNASGAEEAAGTSERVANIAETLKMKVNFFKV